LIASRGFPPRNVGVRHVSVNFYASYKMGAPAQAGAPLLRATGRATGTVRLV
jgi:hypothetical protein